MANDRLYIRHKGSGAEFYLAKSMGDGWYVPAQHKDGRMEQHLNAWLDSLVGEDETGHGLGYGTQLELVTEDHPDHDYGKVASFDGQGRLKDQTAP